MVSLCFPWDAGAIFFLLAFVEGFVLGTDFTEAIHFSATALVWQLAFVRLGRSACEALEALRLAGIPRYIELSEDGVGEQLPVEDDPTV